MCIMHIHRRGRAASDATIPPLGGECGGTDRLRDRRLIAGSALSNNAALAGSAHTRPSTGRGGLDSSRWDESGQIHGTGVSTAACKFGTQVIINVSFLRVRPRGPCHGMREWEMEWASDTEQYSRVRGNTSLPSLRREREAALTPLLGSVHRGVRVLDHLFRTVITRSIDRDANARAGRHLRAG